MITVYLPGGVYHAVKQLGRRINKSAVCSAALAAEVQAIETYDRRRASK